MRLFPTLYLLATTAHAQHLWGWEPTFTIVARLRKAAYTPSQNTINDVSRLRTQEDSSNGYEIVRIDSCVQFGGQDCVSDCRPLQKFNTDGKSVNKSLRNWRSVAVTRGGYDWARIQREDSAWIDLWRRPDGRWDMYENGKDTGALGFCELPVDGKESLSSRCSDADTEAVVALACYQS